MTRTPAKHTGGDRARIVEAFVQTVGARGYVHTKISEVTIGAGVGRARFYELFRDKQDCFLAAQRQLADDLIEQTTAATKSAEPAGAIDATVMILTDLAQERPAAFALLTHESTLAGPRAWEVRQAMIAALAQEIERGSHELPAGPNAELADAHLLGGAMRALGIRVRRGEQHPRKLCQELVTWMQAYSPGSGQQRWSSLAAASHPSDRGLPLGPAEPLPLGRGRHRLARTIAKRTQRERIVHATGRAIAAQGFEDATVADIVAAAGVSREVFYENFHDKREAFAETIKFVFEQIIAVSAGEFFSTDGWPPSIWNALRAFLGFIVDQSELAQAVFTEPYAVGEERQRGDEFVLGFTLFLEDGYRCRPQAADVPRIAGEAIGGTVLEAINAYLRAGRGKQLLELLPGLAYLILAPFMGGDRAYDFILTKAQET